MQAVTKSLRVFVTNSLTVEWRKSLTKQLHQEYFARRKYYDLNALNNGPVQVYTTINMSTFFSKKVSSLKCRQATED